jgi:hypothetical protein
MGAQPQSVQLAEGNLPGVLDEREGAGDVGRGVGWPAIPQGQLGKARPDGIDELDITRTLGRPDERTEDCRPSVQTRGEATTARPKDPGAAS